MEQRSPMRLSLLTTADLGRDEADAIKDAIKNGQNPVPPLLEGGEELNQGLKHVLEKHYRLLLRADVARELEVQTLKAERAALLELLCSMKVNQDFVAAKLNTNTILRDFVIREAETALVDGSLHLIAPKPSPTGKKNKAKDAEMEKQNQAEVAQKKQVIAWAAAGAAQAAKAANTRTKKKGTVDPNMPKPSEYAPVVALLPHDMGALTNPPDEETEEEEESEEEDEEEKAFKPLEMWHASKKEKSTLKAQAADVVPAKTKTKKALGLKPSQVAVGDMNEQFGEPIASHKFIVSPDSDLRLSWDFMSLLMVVYDMVMIPMSAFWGDSDILFFTIMEWTTRLFWTFDMIASVCTGLILPDGTIQLLWRPILQKYLRTWFPIDLFIVGSDWIGVILDSGNMGMSSLVRSLRIARIARLLRLVRVQEIVTDAMDRIQSEYIMIVLKVLRLLVIIIFWSHANACLWWTIGQFDSERSWILDMKLDDDMVGTNYLISLHWATSQFLGGLDSIAPVTVLERFYAMIITVSSTMMLMVLLSSLTSTLTQLCIIGGNVARQMSILKKYLNQNKIPKRLTKRVVRSAKHATTGEIHADSVELLAIVSEPLQIDMSFEIYAGVMSHHPFFNHFMLFERDLMRRLCHGTVSMQYYEDGDIIFAKGEEPLDPKMYFIVAGDASYTDTEAGDDLPVCVTERQWVSEPVLWTTWKHQGTLIAPKYCKLAALRAKAFQDIISKASKKVGPFNPKMYAYEFVEELNVLHEQGKLTDLHFQTKAC
eukprot:TRINITY_DN14282_c0_g2_i1.p1 TRINITY_DN14282_c0_g2~~TRINITY_DN14282_c0_g2_i1.p1  ORF type:complete len:768 (+),score=177.38 TRINITY_DN14282_c0_g2_i1:224-2527(+)